MKLFIFLFAILINFNFCSQSDSRTPPKAVKGFLDLRNHDFTKEPIVSLDGEWEFYPETFCEVETTNIEK